MQFVLTLALVHTLNGGASAQTTQPNLQSALAAVIDHEFSYANTGLYALLSEVQSHGVPATEDSVPLEVWNSLLERSGDYRGRVLTIRGTIARNTRWQFESPEHQPLGPISELQLTRSDTPLVCKLLLTQDASDLPLGADIGVTGYFLMIQQYYSESRQLRHAAILIGVAPTSIERRVVAAATAQSPSALWWVSIIGVGLLAALLLPRLIVRRDRDFRELRAEHGAPLSVADEFRTWSQHDDPAEPR